MGIYATIVVMANFPLFTVSFTAGYNPTRIDEIKGRENEKWGGEGRKEEGRREKKNVFIQGFPDRQGCNDYYTLNHSIYPLAKFKICFASRDVIRMFYNYRNGHDLV